MKIIDYNAIFKRIKFLIKNSDKKQQDLSDHLGMTRQIFYDWKNGKSNPTLLDLFKISKYFGVPLEYIISGDESPIDDATAAFIVSTQGLKEQQKKIIYASIQAQVEMFKKMNGEKK